MRTGGERGRIDGRRRTACQLLDELRSDGHRLPQGAGDRRRSRQRAIEQTVHQILDRPRELGEALRADHAAAALQRVERAPHGTQRVRIRRVAIPLRKILRDLRDFLAGFFDEDLDQLGIDVFADQRGRRAQSA